MPATTPAPALQRPCVELHSADAKALTPRIVMKEHAHGKGTTTQQQGGEETEERQRAAEAAVAGHADDHDGGTRARQEKEVSATAQPGKGATLGGRAGELVRALHLQPHPEGGYYRELYRSPHTVAPLDARGARSALTTIDFLLARGQFSAWHRVASDEAWHLLEGGPLRLSMMPPELDRIEVVELGAASSTLRHVVPAHWWQAAEPLADFAYVGATVGPGFDFVDFSLGRDAVVEVRDAIARLRPELLRLI
jgi:predicted cupin superfamily sugar epimerase